MTEADFTGPVVVDSDGSVDPSSLGGARLLLDANILFSALLREGTTRHLLLYAGLDLHTPGHIWDEFERNRAYLLKKSDATEAAFDLLLDSLKDRIATIPRPVIKSQLNTALEHVEEGDELDAPYVAATMSLDAVLWSQDKKLREAAPVPVVSTADVVEVRGLP